VANAMCSVSAAARSGRRNRPESERHRAAWDAHAHTGSALTILPTPLATAGNQSQGHLIAEPSISYSSLPTSGGPDAEACCFSSTRPVCSTRGYCAAMAVTPPDHLDDASDVDFDVQRSWVGNVIVLTVRGDLDALSAPHLAAAINRGLSGESTAVVVDLSELEFLAASGMSVLLTGHTAAGSSKRFAVVADGPATSRPMTLLGLDRLLDLFPALDAALNDITQHSDA